MSNRGFNAKTAQQIGRIGGKASAKKRWGNKDPATKRIKSFLVAVSPAELEAINHKAQVHGISRTELIIRAVSAYKSAADEVAID